MKDTIRSTLVNDQTENSFLFLFLTKFKLLIVKFVLQLLFAEKYYFTSYKKKQRLTLFLSLSVTFLCTVPGSPVTWRLEK